MYPLPGGALHMVQLLYLPKGKRRRKGDREEGLCPAQSLSCCCSSFSAHFSGFRTHTPESHCHQWNTHMCVLACTHTHTFSYPQEWFMIPPLIPPGEQWLRVRGARRKDRVQYSEVKREECNDEQSGLQCFEEAADALCNRSLAEHELHDAQCRF